MMTLENKEIVKEANVYAALYLNFNDDNTEHMYNSFFNNGLDTLTEDELRERNIQFLNEVLQHDTNIADVILEIANTKHHFN